MKYAIVRQDGVTEIREDNYPLQEGSIVLNDEQYNQLISGQYILENGQIVINPNPPKDL
jgi:hypothetical protein